MRPNDPLRAKREQVANLMNAALDASFDQRMDVQVIEWKLNRRRDQRFSPDMPDIRNADEAQLDALIDHYGSSAGYVW